MSGRGGKRKQVLQMGSASKLHCYGYSKQFHTSENKGKGSVPILVGDYSDTDSEDSKEAEEQTATDMKEEEANLACDTPDGSVKQEQPSDMDDELKNFLSEIEAIPVPTEKDNTEQSLVPTKDHKIKPEKAVEPDADTESPVETVQDVPKPISKTKPSSYYSMFVKGESEFVHSPKQDAEDVNSPVAVKDDIPHEPTTNWQMVKDENTHYHYYWNTVTNEVTWEIPTEYTQYLLLHREYEEKIARLTPEQLQKLKEKHPMTAVKNSGDSRADAASRLAHSEHADFHSSVSSATQGPDGRPSKAILNAGHAGRGVRDTSRSRSVSPHPEASQNSKHHRHKKEKKSHHKKKHKRRHEDSQSDEDRHSPKVPDIKKQPVLSTDSSVATILPGSRLTSIVPYLSDQDDSDEDYNVDPVPQLGSVAVSATDSKEKEHKETPTDKETLIVKEKPTHEEDPSELELSSTASQDSQNSTAKVVFQLVLPSTQTTDVNSASSSPVLAQPQPPPAKEEETTKDQTPEASPDLKEIVTHRLDQPLTDSHTDLSKDKLDTDSDRPMIDSVVPAVDSKFDDQEVNEIMSAMVDPVSITQLPDETNTRAGTKPDSHVEVTHHVKELKKPRFKEVIDMFAEDFPMPVPIQINNISPVDKGSVVTDDHIKKGLESLEEVMEEGEILEILENEVKMLKKEEKDSIVIQENIFEMEIKMQDTSLKKPSKLQENNLEKPSKTQENNSEKKSKVQDTSLEKPSKLQENNLEKRSKTQENNSEKKSKVQDTSLEKPSKLQENNLEKPSKMQENNSEKKSKIQDTSLEKPSKTQGNNSEKKSKIQDTSLEKPSKVRVNNLEKKSKTQEDSFEKKSKTQEDSFEKKSKTQEDSFEKKSKTQEDSFEKKSKTQEDSFEKKSKSQEDSFEKKSKSRENNLEKKGKTREDSFEKRSKVRENSSETNRIKTEKSKNRAQENSTEKIRSKTPENSFEKSRSKIRENNSEKIRSKTQEKNSEKSRSKTRENSSEKVRSKTQENSSEKGRSKTRENSSEKVRSKTQENSSEKSRSKTQGNSLEKKSKVVEQSTLTSVNIVGYASDDEEEEGEVREIVVKKDDKPTHIKQTDKMMKLTDKKKDSKKHRKNSKTILSSSTDNKLDKELVSQIPATLSQLTSEASSQRVSEKTPEKVCEDDDDGDIDFDIDDIDRALEVALEKKLEKKKKHLSQLQQQAAADDDEIKVKDAIINSVTSGELVPGQVVSDTPDIPARGLEKAASETSGKGNSTADSLKKVACNKMEESTHQEDVKLVDDIKDMAELALNKLEFLDISTDNLSRLQVLFIELQTRFTDWTAGGLSTQYFHEQLKTAEHLLEQYELSAVPEGWACQWDRSNNRYYYRNKVTDSIQWEYPEVESKVDVDTAEPAAENSDESTSRVRDKGSDEHHRSRSSGSSRHRRREDKEKSKRDRRSSSRHYHRKRRRGRDHSNSSNSSSESQHRRHRKSKKKKRHRAERSPSVEIVENMDDNLDGVEIIEAPVYPTTVSTPPLADSTVLTASPALSPAPGDASTTDHQSHAVDTEAGLDVGQSGVDSAQDGLDADVDGFPLQPGEEIVAQEMPEGHVQEEAADVINPAVISKPPQIVIHPQMIATLNPDDHLIAELYSATQIVPPAQASFYPSYLAAPASEQAVSAADMATEASEASLENTKKKKKDKKPLATGSSIMMKKKHMTSMVQKWQKVKMEVEKEDLAKELRQAAIRKKIEELKTTDKSDKQS